MSRPAGAGGGPPWHRCGQGLVWSAVTLGLVLSMAPSTARGNGAFPGSLRIFAPPDQPQEILLATNFGLISSADDGRSWAWICEHGDALLASLYELGPGAHPRLYGAGPIGLAVSEDGACGWIAYPELQAAVVTGIFADPADGARVWVVARPRQASPGDGFGLYLSTDGGVSFGSPRYRVPLGATIDSVESARSRPGRVYLTVSGRGQPPTVEIVRSDDGGMTFTAFDLSAPTRGDRLRIAAVDPGDPARLYLRAQGFPDERLVVSTDGGETLTDALVIERGRLSAFVRRADGSLVAGGISDVRGGSVHVSIDGGRSFALRSSAIHPGALVERGGVLWASTDNTRDGFAVARSRDASTWEPAVRYVDVTGTRACPGQPSLAETCAAACIQQVVRGVFTEKTCGVGPPPPPEVGLVEPPTGAGDGGDGCSCRLATRGAVGPGARRPGGLPWLLLGVLRICAARTRRRSHRPRVSSEARSIGGLAALRESHPT